MRFPDRPFSHCLRALVVLGRGSVAEKVVADAIILPLARSALTQGRVDGTGGRGSFAGLKEGLSFALSLSHTHILYIYNFLSFFTHIP